MTPQQSVAETRPEGDRERENGLLRDADEAAGVDSDVSLNHRFIHDGSILAIVATEGTVFAGTQGGEILVFALRTCERVACIHAHHGSVLGLCLSEDKRLLFSSAGDRLVNVWDAQKLTHEASIYSLHDVGDIFCVSYSSITQTIYLGCQNTSIQWYELGAANEHPSPDQSSFPAQRHDQFFDSKGPGVASLSPPQRRKHPQLAAYTGRMLQIDPTNVYQFAHYGYVFCTLLIKGSRIASDREELLISGGGDGSVNIWMLSDDPQDRIHLLTTLKDAEDEPEPVLCFAIDGSFLFAGRAGGTIDTWDLESQQLVRSVKQSDADILSVAVGRGYLFSGDEHGAIQRYDNKYEHLCTLNGHNGRVLASTFHVCDDRPVLLTGSSDKSLASWNIENCSSPTTVSSAKSEEDLVANLRRFVAFRTISAEASCKPDCHRGASFLRGLFKRFGAATELLSHTEGLNPVVYAHFKHSHSAKPSRSILFYGHYDVVPAVNRGKIWLDDPFSLVGRNGYLYGRGSSDNKGPLLAAVYAVADLLAVNALTSDVTFLIEGEEECGSRGFKETVEANKDRIGPVDWILLANSYWLDDEHPCLTYGLRGVIQATVHVSSEQPDLHSGVDGSRLLDEPLKDLVMLVGSLTGRNGTVNIPEFYDAIPPLSKDEKRLYSEIATTLLERDPALGTRESLTESLIERWRNATLTIHNFRTSGSEKQTIIPHQAQVSLSLRIVPNQSAQKISESLIAFAKAQFSKLGSRNRLDIVIHQVSEPWLGDYRNEVFRTLEGAVIDVWSNPDMQTPRLSMNKRHSHLISPPLPPIIDQLNALPAQPFGLPPSPATSSTLASSSNKEASPVLVSKTSPKSRRKPSQGDIAPLTLATSDSSTASPNPPQKEIQKPLYIREGGSIPAIRFLETCFNAPAAHLPCGQASDNAHLENERIRLINLVNARRVFRRVFGAYANTSDL